MAEKRVRDAARKAAKDKVAIASIVCFSAVTIAFAHKVSGDEALKILFGGVGTFFAAAWLYMRSE